MNVHSPLQSAAVASLGYCPGWLLIDAGVGLSITTIIASGSATLAAAEASTGSALIMTSRWIGQANS